MNCVYGLALCAIRLWAMFTEIPRKPKAETGRIAEKSHLHHSPTLPNSSGTGWRRRGRGLRNGASLSARALSMPAGAPIRCAGGPWP